MSRDTAPFSRYDANSRLSASRTSYVTIVYWHWRRENFGEPSNISSDADSLAALGWFETGMIEQDIESCSVVKNIDQPSATFNFTLYPSQNWKSLLSPGDWVAVYFRSTLETKPGSRPRDTKGLVLLGNIDRISRVIQKDEETDTTTLRYSISGRNFGKVFETTDIWFDPYAIQVSTLDAALRTQGLEIVGNPSDQVDKILDVFLGDGASFPNGSTSPLKQWMIPSDVSNLFAGGGTYFNSILTRQIQGGLPGFKPRNMLTPNSNGSLWDMLKRSCNDIVNELYLEEVRKGDGNAYPTIVLRPRPFQTPGFTGSGGVPFKSLQAYSRENFVEIFQNEVIYEDLGRDDHSRLNMFWFNTTLEYEYLLNPRSGMGEAAKGITNPVFSTPSIQRHGLRRMEALLDYCHVEGPGGIAAQGPQRNNDLFKGFAHQIYDMNAYNHLYEQGTIECSGVLQAELGKVLVINAGKKLPYQKIYYIEGYEHKWHFPNLWTTVFTVSKGQVRGLGESIFIDLGTSDGGVPDETLDFTYVAKTDVTGKD